MFKVLIVIHIVAGTLAGLAGTVAISVRKPVRAESGGKPPLSKALDALQH